MSSLLGACAIALVGSTVCGVVQFFVLRDTGQKGKINLGAASGLPLFLSLTSLAVLAAALSTLHSAGTGQAVAVLVSYALGLGLGPWLASTMDRR